jgi:hypothetical protein
MSGVCLYALLSAPPSCETGRGICAEPLRIVRSGDLVALVGDVTEMPAPSAVILRAQDAVLRRLAVVLDAVMPVRFGTVLPDEAALTDVLSQRRPRLTQALGRIAGCEQMTLRLWRELADGAAAPPPRSGTVPELEALLQRLGDVIREERAERHDRPPLVATAQHLIRRGTSARYIDGVNAARDSLRPCRVSVTGPWLPYAFTEEAA